MDDPIGPRIVRIVDHEDQILDTAKADYPSDVAEYLQECSRACVAAPHRSKHASSRTMRATCSEEGNAALSRPTPAMTLKEQTPRQDAHAPAHASTWIKAWASVPYVQYLSRG